MTGGTGSLCTYLCTEAPALLAVADGVAKRWSSAERSGARRTCGAGLRPARRVVVVLGRRNWLEVMDSFDMLWA